MNLKSNTAMITKSINKKIEKDIKIAQKDRLIGNMGTPIEEVLINMKKIIEGENL